MATARAFVASTLGYGNPDVDVAALLVSELVTNSLRHSNSARAGGNITITVTAGMAGGGSVRVEVTDDGAATLPVVRSAAATEEGGRGMQLVTALAADWGCQRHSGATTTWFELAPGPDPAWTRPEGMHPVANPADAIPGSRARPK